jgi:hypothetical protein
MCPPRWFLCLPLHHHLHPRHHLVLYLTLLPPPSSPPQTHLRRLLPGISHFLQRVSPPSFLPTPLLLTRGPPPLSPTPSFLPSGILLPLLQFAASSLSITYRPRLLPLLSTASRPPHRTSPPPRFSLNASPRSSPCPPLPVCLPSPPRLLQTPLLPALNVTLALVLFIDLSSYCLTELVPTIATSSCLTSSSLHPHTSAPFFAHPLYLRTLSPTQPPFFLIPHNISMGDNLCLAYISFHRLNPFLRQLDFLPSVTFSLPLS